MDVVVARAASSVVLRHTLAVDECRLGAETEVVVVVVAASRAVLEVTPADDTLGLAVVVEATREARLEEVVVAATLAVLVDGPLVLAVTVQIGRAHV